MANIFWKHLCFSPFKCLPTSVPPPSSPPHQTLINNNPNLFSSSSSDSPPPDISSLYASDRFFFSSPGQSNSILDSPEKSTPTTPSTAGASVDGGVAVQTDSPDPYLDFRRSMQEMVEAREYTDVEGDWDYLHELLLCYLMLNPKHTHKFIVGAFSDLIISLMDSTVSSRRKVDNRPKADRCPDCCSTSGSESAFSLVMKA